MRAKALQKAGRILASGRLATLLLAFLGVWAVLASFVPQGDASAAAVAEWSLSNASLEPVVRFLGLHHAFTAPLFVACIAVLAVSTALCAWQRTRVAIKRASLLRQAALPDQQMIPDPDISMACDPALDASSILDVASRTLAALGIGVKRRGGRIAAVSAPWSAWGSPVFHWALLALILIMPLGTLVRSSGQIGLAVGQSAEDRPGSYALLTAGPLRNWDGVRRTIRLDAFEVNYKSGGVNRGATPTVSILNAKGEVVKSQRVYPNRTLKLNALTIYPLDYGLSATVSIVETGGAGERTSTQLLDFSGKAEGGTAPVAPLVIADAGGAEQLKVYVSVPLDRVEGGYLGRLPEVLRARIIVASPAGEALLDQTLTPGQDLALPNGSSLRLVDVGYYSRLQLVDDPSIPFLYAAAVVSILGLGVATLARQMIVLAWVEDTPEGARLALRLRLWRNVTTSRDEIETELRRALGVAEEGTPE